MIRRRELLAAGIATGLVGLRPLRAQPLGAVITNKFLVEDGRVLLSAMIGTNGPFPFVLDTGGQLGIIDRALAEKLGLRKVPNRALTSVGGRHDEPWYLVEGMALANGRLPPLTFIGLERGLDRRRGTVGSIGVALFTSNDADLDFSKGELRIHQGTRPSRDGWTRLNSRFILGERNPPLIALEVDLDGYQVALVADTGAPGNITLDAPASKASGLWNDAQPYAPAGMRGIGTALARRRIVRANKLKISTFEFNDVLVALSPPDTGEDYRYTGMIGLGILSQMNLSSDTANKALWAQSSDRSHPVRVNYSLSGLWLVERRGLVVVDDVGTGSPAKTAGIMPGDTMPSLSLPKAIEAIGGRPGQKVTLQLERGGEVRKFEITLAEYL